MSSNFFSILIFLETERVYKSVDCERDIPYGPTEREKLDIFGATSLPKGKHIAVSSMLLF